MARGATASHCQLALSAFRRCCDLSAEIWSCLGVLAPIAPVPNRDAQIVVEALQIPANLKSGSF